ncbi:MAG TPA: ABC transporter permease [Puia sp.]|nr:ABC transporter permease [Puia sp.]
MLKNYLKTAFRHIGRHKTYAAVNIIGLSVGITAFIVILLFVRYEYSFDNFHKDKERIYRLVSVPYTTSSSFAPTAAVPLPVAEGLRLDFPQLESVAAIFGRDGQVTIQGTADGTDKKFNESGDLYFAEPSFFDIFNFKFLSGDPNTALTQPNSVVLSQDIAIKYFGDWHSAIGKTIKYENRDIFQVTGILANPPSNSDFPLKIVVSYKSLKNIDVNDWVGTYGRGYCFVKLPPGLTARKFNMALRDFVKKHKPADHASEGIVLQQLSDMHFNSTFENYNRRIFSRQLLVSLSLVGIFLLVIACVNFINLATAQSINRSKEIGVRKVLGSSRSRLILQHLGEAGLVTVFALVVAVNLLVLVIPPVNQLLEANLALRFNGPFLILTLGAIFLGVTLLSGFYPALVCSSFHPINALKNKLSAASNRGINFRRGLVIGQFFIAQALVICVLVMIHQMELFHHAPLGFDKESVVTLPIPGDSASQSKMEAVRSELLALPGITAISFSTFSPLDNDIWANSFKFDHNPKKTDFLTYFKWADASYFNTYHLELAAGRFYSPSDTLREFVVNETLVSKLGFRDPKDILGKEIKFWDNVKAPVVGVVKDFHTISLQTPIVPVVMGCAKEAYSLAGVRINPKFSERIMPAIESIWKQAYPDFVYEYQFLDDKIDGYYKDENRLSELYRIFAGLAILISCLGLFGLVSLIVAQRTKEVGIRKVLGASAFQITYMISKEFTLLVLCAFIIAVPVAWMIMNGWLENFSYRVAVSPLTIVLAMIFSIAIAWATVGYKSIKAALANPVKSLRTE